MEVSQGIENWFKKNNIFQKLSLTDKIIFVFLILMTISAFGLSIYNSLEVEKLRRPMINSTLYLSGPDNNTLSILPEYKTIYRFDTKNYNFESSTSYNGYFRVIVKTIGNQPLSSIYFKVLDDKERNITTNNIVVPQNNMAIEFKTVGYSEFLSLQAKINQSNIVLDSLSIHAVGESVKGFL